MTDFEQSAKFDVVRMIVPQIHRWRNLEPVPGTTPAGLARPYGGRCESEGGRTDHPECLAGVRTDGRLYGQAVAVCAEDREEGAAKGKTTPCVDGASGTGGGEVECIAPAPSRERVADTYTSTQLTEEEKKIVEEIEAQREGALGFLSNEASLACAFALTRGATHRARTAARGVHIAGGLHRGGRRLHVRFSRGAGGQRQHEHRNSC